MLPSAFGFVPLIGLFIMGVFFVVRAVRRHRILVHGVPIEFELLGARKLLGFPVRYRANGRTEEKVIDLPVTLSPVPEEPASDAMLIADPAHPERCISARRGMFEQALGWQATAAHIASVLSRADVELSREVRADLAIVPADSEEAKAWVSVLDRHLGTNRALEQWMMRVLPELSPEKRRAICKLTCARRIERRRTRRIKSAMSFGTAWVAYLAAIGGTGEVLWMMPVLAVGPIAYAVISLVGVED